MTARRGSPRARLAVLTLAVLLLPLAAALGAAPASAGAVWQTGYSFDARADGFLDVAQGPGGAIYCVGFTRGTPGSSLLLVAKYVDNGAAVSLAWTRTFRKTGVTGSRADRVAVDRSGNVIVSGTVGTGRHRDIVVLKYSAAGDRRWRTYYNGTAHRDDYLTGLGLDRRGNAYVSGTSRGRGTGLDFVTVKVRSGGGRSWVRRYAGPTGRDETAGIAVLRSGDCFVAGSSARGSHERAVTIKYSVGGAFRWRSTYANLVGHVHVGGIAATGTNGVVVGGGTWNGNAEGSDALFLKYRAANGTRAWRAFIGNGAMFGDWVEAVATDAAGAVYGAGATHDENAVVTHGFTCSVSAAGVPAWGDEFWKDLVTNDARFQASAADAAGDSAAGGWAQTVLAGNDFAVLYRSHLGAPWSWDFTTGGLAIGDDVCRSVLVDGTVVYAAGELFNGASGTDAALFKLTL